MFVHNSFSETTEDIPEHVVKKKDIFGSDYLSDFSEVAKKPYLKMKSLDLKIIDFGGASYDDEYHSRII